MRSACSSIEADSRRAIYGHLRYRTHSWYGAGAMRASENQSNRFSRVAMELELILERELTTQRPPGGTMTDVHVCQHESGKWHINVRVSWRGTALYHVGLSDKKRIRLYKKASSAIRHIDRNSVGEGKRGRA